MANTEHLKQLEKGVESWNAWREENPDIKPDLNGISLHKLDLNKVNFKNVDLSNSNLSQTIFHYANLRQANLSNVKFDKVTLIDADLSNADLSNAQFNETTFNNAKLYAAILNKANFKNCPLHGANLSSAYLNKVNLTEAFLDNANLCDADLSQANLRGANLQNTNLENANLWKANLSSGDLGNTGTSNIAIKRTTNLNCANLSGADLSHTNISYADLNNASLTGANLQSAILIKTNLKGATTSNAKFGGSETTNAILPKEINFEKDLEVFDEASKIARKHFAWLMAGLAFSLLTIFSTDDVALLTNSPTTPLPIIQTPIPLAGFYLVAPFLLVSLYFYFHIQLQHNWRIVARFPAIFPDGVPIDQKLFPWQLNMWCRNFFPLINPDKKLHAKPRDFLIIFLTWWSTPVVLLFFWYRYLPRHDLGTWYHIALLIITSFCALNFYRWAKTIFPSNLSLTKSDSLTLVLLIIINLSVIGSMHPNFQKLDFRIANFYQKDVSYKPDNWDPQNPTQGVKGAELRDKDLRFAFAPEAFLVKANLHRANLTKSNFKKADFKEANLFMANFNEAILTKAQLQNTNLRRAKFIGAKLQEVNFSNANLNEANLKGIILKMTNLDGANLKSANLTDADLTLVKNLTCIQLQSAYINTKTKIPYYLKISKGTMYKKSFKNWKIEALKDYQCEEVKITLAK